MLEDGRDRGIVRTGLARVASFLAVSSLFIAMVAVMLLLFSFLLYGIPVDPRLLLASFFITFSVYSLNKLTDVKEDAINLPERTRFIARHKRAITVAVVGAVTAALLIALSYSVYSMLVISSPLIIGFAYSVGVEGFKLKHIAGLKSVLVALSWTLVASLLPITIVARGEVEVLLVVWFFFVKTFINVTLFDVRDVDGDRQRGVKTIPVLLGRGQTRNLLLAVNTSLLLWLEYCYLTGVFATYIPLLAIFVVYGYWYILEYADGPIAEGRLDVMVDGEWFFVLLAAALTTSASVPAL